jgi:general stress protein 26
MLNAQQIRLIEQNRLGYVASVNSDGSPNLSPKGTFMVIDPTRIAFAEIRSPQTASNIKGRPEVEVNFVDVFSRKGVRVRGIAQMRLKGTQVFEDFFPRFRDAWGDELASRFNGIIDIDIEWVKPLMSPVYELGADESALRKEWMMRYQSQQKGQFDA